MKFLMWLLVTGMLFVGCNKATLTSVEQVADEPQTPTEYVWTDTLLATSAQRDDWIVAPLLESGTLPGNHGWHDGVFKYSADFWTNFGGWNQPIGGWIWSSGAGVCAYDSVAVTGRVTMNLQYAEADFTPSFVVGRSPVAGSWTIHRESSESVSHVIPFAVGITPDERRWNCGARVRFLVVAQIRSDLLEAAPQANHAHVFVKVDSVEVRGFCKIPVTPDQHSR